MKKLLLFLYDDNSNQRGGGGWGVGGGGNYACIMITCLRGLDILNRFSAVFYKGDKICNFLFVLLSSTPIVPLEMG